MNSGWAESEYRAFLYKRFMFDDDPPASIKNIARKMGCSISLIYKYFEGEKVPPPEFFPTLYNITGDIGIIQWFTDRCDGLSLRRTNPENINGDFDDDLEKGIDIINSLFKERRDSLKDGKIDNIEKQNISKLIQELRDTADTIEEEINQWKM